MANEVSWSSFKTDAGLTEALNAVIHEDLRDEVDMTSYLPSLGDFAGSGSDTKKVTAYLLNNTMAAAGSENASVSNSAVSKRSFTGTVARQTIAFEKSDLATILKGNVIDVAGLVELIKYAARMRRMAMLCAAFPNFATIKGTSAAALTIDDMYNAQYALTIAMNRADGIIAVLKPKQITQVQDDLRAEGGAVQWMAQTQEMLKIKGQGYAGNFNGIDYFAAPSVTDDATNYAGGVFAPGGVYQGFASAQPAAGSIALPSGSSLFIEVDRTARTALSAFIGHDYYLITEGEDLRCVRMRSGV